ncbi:transposase [Rhodococcus sp. H29-C3]|uniref:transposase n=1 Tax=Rhodococcus sp. H29-C3 TaxID=3046307 RepID=UPI0024BBC8A3|nr:transposase [Rhodococcus sp. H29-C3]MDJ0363038.1 transposase [Rhodococcus sp. H29-C3]
MRAGYTPQTRGWALEEYKKSRPNYGSRAECVAALAVAIGAHENTVARWIKLEYGPPRLPAADETVVRMRAVEAENERLRNENLTLTARLAAYVPRSIAGESLGAAAL